LREAVGDVCSRFFDRAGEEIAFEGSGRLLAVEREILRHVPVTIAVTVGLDTVDSIIAGVRGGYLRDPQAW
jgi:DNA-binding transcriptional regulator LsrR (DeoR family)